MMVRQFYGRRLSLHACFAITWLLCIGVQADLTIDLTYIGNAGNVADTTGYGAVTSPYYISTYEITVGQYAEFLNSVAQADPYGLYNPSMASGPLGPFLLQSGLEGSYAYTAVSGKEDEPVRYVSFYDSLRFSNWLANGQGTGNTETGSYEMALGDFVERGSNATWVLPTEDEWYKAAYYDPVSGLYYDYPNGTDAIPSEPTDETTPRSMNFGDAPYWQTTGYYTATGETTGISPFGTYDQGGNVREWIETRSVQFPDHIIRGGGFTSDANDLNATTAYGYGPDTEGAGFGFRVAFIVPEPSTVMLLFFGLLSSLLFRKK